MPNIGVYHLMNKQPKMIEMPDNVSPAYSNLARISHSPADIVIDFAHILPGEQVGKVSSRIVMSPISAKLLMKALVEHIGSYESTFGEIKLPNTSLAENLFNKTNPQTEHKEGEAEDGTTG